MNLKRPFEPRREYGKHLGYVTDRNDPQQLHRKSRCCWGKTMALVGAMTGLKDALSSVPPDPTKLAEAIDKVTPVPQNLASLMPMVAFPQLVGTCIDIVVRALEDARAQVIALNQELAALVKVEETAHQLKDERLHRVFTCAKHNVHQEAANLGKTMASIGSLMAIIETLASLPQLPMHVPSFSHFDGMDIEGAIKPLDDCITAFKALRKAVPL